MINKQFSIGNPILTYDECDVNKRMLKEILARGSSEENDQCLFIFMLHDDSIYCWKCCDQQTLSEAESDLDTFGDYNKRNFKKVASTSSDGFYQINDQEFFFVHEVMHPDDSNYLVRQEVKKITVNYSEYYMETYY